LAMASRLRHLRCLTFEVSGMRRQAVPAARCCVTMGATRPAQPAVACRLDRGVRPRPVARRHALPSYFLVNVKLHTLASSLVPDPLGPSKWALMR
jgi:hypothetical protein